MQTRLLACLAGGFLGLVAAFPVGGSFGLSPTIALLGCASIGVALGYVASLLIDVFTASPRNSQRRIRKPPGGSQYPTNPTTDGAWVL